MTLTFTFTSRRWVWVAVLRVSVASIATFPGGFGVEAITSGTGGSSGTCITTPATPTPTTCSDSSTHSTKPSIVSSSDSKGVTITETSPQQCQQVVEEHAGQPYHSKSVVDDDSNQPEGCSLLPSKIDTPPHRSRSFTGLADDIGDDLTALGDRVGDALRQADNDDNAQVAPCEGGTCSGAERVRVEEECIRSTDEAEEKCNDESDEESNGKSDDDGGDGDDGDESDDSDDDDDGDREDSGENTSSTEESTTDHQLATIECTGKDDDSTENDYFSQGENTVLSRGKQHHLPLSMPDEFSLNTQDRVVDGSSDRIITAIKESEEQETGGIIVCGEGGEHQKVCSKGQVCCNHSCGICVPRGQTCLEIACGGVTQRSGPTRVRVIWCTRKYK